MKTPEKPESEDTRIETLYALSILDTPPEERFDRLTRLAKKTFNVPIAVVSLVDTDRQWFKSSVGLDVCETSRQISFCGHAILSDSPFIVYDTFKDERFADNPLVISPPNIRFYAGIPLQAINKQRLGTFCIIDSKPRSFDVTDIQTLKDIASMAEREINFVELATLDDLTKISNRRGFMMLGKNTLSFCKREMIPVSLVYFDLNGFKKINDRHGHLEGDKLLVHFADVLNKILRESDIVGRLGGDEFAALLYNSGRLEAEKIVLRLRNQLDRDFEEELLNHEIKFSYGIVEYDPHLHGSIKELLSDGDYKMYEDKHSRGYENIASLKKQV